MSGLARIGKTKWVRNAAVFMAVLFLSSMAGAGSGPTNQIRDVQVSEKGGKTIVTVVGSKRPSFTAFKLGSPKRLVIDIAESAVRGAPPVIEKGTSIIDGVAISEYSVKGVPVSRVMINFQNDAAYRIRVKGNKLVASLSGSPKAKGAPSVAVSGGHAEAELEKARSEAAEAKKRHGEALAELEKLKAESVRRGLEAEAARKEAKKAIALVEKVETGQTVEERRRHAAHKRELAKATRELEKYKGQISKAEKLVAAEKAQREALELEHAALEKKLAEATRAKTQSDEALAQAGVRSEELKKVAKRNAAKAAEAEQEAKRALAAQRKAAAALKRAKEGERSKYAEELSERESQTAQAKSKLAQAASEHLKTQRALRRSLAELNRATADAGKAGREQKKLKDRMARTQADAEKKIARAEKKALTAEKRADEARKAKQAAELELATMKRQSEMRTAKTQRDADRQVAAARKKLTEAKKAKERAVAELARVAEDVDEYEHIARLSQSRADGLTKKLAKANEKARVAEARADAVEKDLANARSTIASQEKKLGEMAAKNEAREKTQEEIRLERLAALNGKAPKAKKAVAKSAPAATSKASPVIENIEFVDEGEYQKVVIHASSPLPYTTSTDDNGNASLRFKDASLASVLERSLDVTDFGGVIGSIGSFEKGGEVQVDVGVERLAANSLKRQGNTIEWTFTQRKGAVAPANKKPTPIGSRSRTVAREDSGAYAYPFERTAGITAGTEGRKRKKRYSGRRIDLDFKDADIHNILRLLADVGHVNIITADDVSGAVTIRMRDVAWDHALDVILQAKRLGMVREGNLIRVAPQETLEKEREMEIARRKQKVALEPLETRLIPVSYAEAAELKPRATDLVTERGTLSVDERTNVIIARDTKGALDQIEALIRNLDTQTPQVLIESRIVEATSTYSREIGIQWGGDFTASSATGNPTGLAFPSSVGLAGGAVDSQTPVGGMTPVLGGMPNPNFAVNLPASAGTGQGGALGITLGSIANNANLSLRLSAMEESGTLRILSSPKILTLDNREAHIEQGTMIPYSQISSQGIQTSFKEAKLNLTVTPHVTADGSVLLQMKVSRDEPDFNNTGARGDPTILKREAETELLVNDGHTAVIGGIFTRNHGTSYSKVPFFADIPILGWLFKKRSDSDRRSEMLIFITPRIVNRAESIGS